MDHTSQLQDRGRGSLIGGAVGDALGYAVEFEPLYSILARYGEPGITDYELSAGKALFSDDTQMTLFTAEGLLRAAQDGDLSVQAVTRFLADSYLAWYRTQTEHPAKIPGSWLSEVSELWALRAPGNTCLSALRAISAKGSLDAVSNMSKGCGGVMRVAPFGIFAAAHPDQLSPSAAAELAGAAAEITHKHPLSTLASMAQAMIVAECMRREEVDSRQFAEIILGSVLPMLAQWRGEDDEHYRAFDELLRRAISLAESQTRDFDAIRALGEGWVGDEALAIAVYSVARHSRDFERCVVCAVNHDGDSDSTGAVAGNIIGSILGLKAIPQKYTNALELRDTLLSMADDLCGLTPPQQMQARYAKS